MKSLSGFKVLTIQRAFAALLTSIDNLSVEKRPPDVFGGRHHCHLSRMREMKASKNSLSERFGNCQFVINAIINHRCLGQELGHIGTELVEGSNAFIDDGTFQYAQKVVLLREFGQKVSIEEAWQSHNVLFGFRKDRLAAISSKNPFLGCCVDLHRFS